MSNGEDKVQTLKQAELFAGIADSTVSRLAEIAEFHHYKDGEIIYEFGDEATNAYVLVSGRVSFTLQFGDKTQTSGSIMTSRQVFGWAALIEHQPERIATAVCIEPSSVLAINGDKMMSIFEEDTAGGFKVMKRLSSMIVMKRLSSMIARNILDNP